jgi:hypothetical protein
MQKFECCPACGEKSSQVEYDLQHHRCGWIWSQPGGGHATQPPVTDYDQVLAALKGMVADFEKFGRYGSRLACEARAWIAATSREPADYGSTLAIEANAACQAARAAVAKAEGA